MINFASEKDYETEKKAIKLNFWGASMLVARLIHDHNFDKDDPDFHRLHQLHIHTTNLLEQSKWIGIDDVKPLPVLKDKKGKLTKKYSTRDWFTKLNEELDEAKEYANQADVLREYHYKNDPEKWYVPHIAEELQDIITVCTSYLEALGFDEAKRSQLAKKVNEKNRKRGYFEEN